MSKRRRLRRWRPFKEARDFIRSLRLKNQADWRRYSTSGWKPRDIPSSPMKIYRKDWIDLKNWLGTKPIESLKMDDLMGRLYNSNETKEFIAETILTHVEEKLAIKSKFIPFEEAREFVHTLNLKSMREWKEYCKSGLKPDDIPFSPNAYYKDKGWISCGDFLGTGVIASNLMKFKSFEEAREFVRTLNLKNIREWREYCKSGLKPDNIPFTPDAVYKDKGWQGFKNWLFKDFQCTFIPYKEAREFVHTLNLKNMQEWKEYCNSGELPTNIPKTPHYFYKNNGWESYGEWLGTGTIAASLVKFLPFEEAREFVHTLNLKSKSEWDAYYKSGNRPRNIPSNPHIHYRHTGWKGIKDWLGEYKDNTTNTNDQYLHSESFVQPNANDFSFEIIISA